MLLFREHARDAATFEAGQAFDFGVPSGEPAFEEDGRGRDVRFVGRAEGFLRTGVTVDVAARGGDVD